MARVVDTTRVCGLLVGLGLSGLPVVAAAAPAPPPPPPRQTPPPAAEAEAQADEEATPPAARAPTPRSTPPAPGTTPPAPGDSGAAGEPAQPGEPQPEVDLSSTWGYSRGRIPQPRYVRPESAGPTPANPPGFYSGVRLEGNQTPPVPADPNAKASIITWTGFERTPTGSRVFLQLSEEAKYDVKQRGSTITIRLRRTRVNVKNNQRFLDLRYFSTPVQMVRVKRRGRDTLLVLTLKRAAQPDVRLMEREGRPLLVVAFEHDSQAAPAPTAAPNPAR